MGNWCSKAQKKKSTAEITPSDLLVKKPSSIVKLYGAPNDITTAYLRYALHYKPVKSEQLKKRKCASLEASEINGEKIVADLSIKNTISDSENETGYEFFNGLHQWDRASVQVEISDPTYQKWLLDISSSGDDLDEYDNGGKCKKLLVFSGNDYLGLSSHPTVIKAAIKAAQEHGMGPRGSEEKLAETLDKPLNDSGEKEREHKILQGFSKAIWNVSNEYNKKLKIAQNEICVLKYST